jgi:hypothetical protein
LALRPTNDRLPPRTPERATLPRELGRAYERDPADLLLMPRPRDPRLKCATPPRPPPKCATPPRPPPKCATPPPKCAPPPCPPLPPCPPPPPRGAACAATDNTAARKIATTGVRNLVMIYSRAAPTNLPQRLFSELERPMGQQSSRPRQIPQRGGQDLRRVSASIHGSHPQQVLRAPKPCA